MNVTQLIITSHAYDRYCQRVGPVAFEALTQLCHEHLQKNNYRRKRDYIQLDGVWWRFGYNDGTMKLHTCYGRHHIDLPEAIKWAKRYNDRISLGDVYAD